MHYNTIKRKGFTLIELLVTLALIFLVLSGIFSVYFFGDRTFKGGSSQFDLQNDIRFALESLTNDLRYATNLEILVLDDTGKATLQELYSGIYHNIDNPYETYIFFDSTSDSVVKISRETKTTYQVKSDEEDVLTFTDASAERLQYVLKGVKDSSNNEFDVNSEILLLNILTPDASTGIINSLDSTSGNAIKYTAPSSYISELQYPVVQTIEVNNDKEVKLGFDKQVKRKGFSIEPGSASNKLTAANIIFYPVDGNTITTSMKIEFKLIGSNPKNFVDGDTINLVLTYGGTNIDDYEAYFTLVYIGGGTKQWVIQ